MLKLWLDFLWLQSLDPRMPVFQFPFSHSPKRLKSEVASYLKHVLLVQFEMFVFPWRFFFFCFLWGMKKNMPSRSCDQFPPTSNSIHLLPRIDSIQLEVLSLLFQIWKICFLFGPFLCSSFTSLVTFPLFSPLGHPVLIVISQCACSFDSLPAKPRGKPFMHGRTS